MVQTRSRMPSGTIMLSWYPSSSVPAITGSGFISLPTASASRNRTGSPETTYPAQGRVLTGAKLSVTAAISVTSVVVDVDHPLDPEPVRSATEIAAPGHVRHGRFHFSAVR